MFTFFIAVILLILGYIIYGKFVEKFFGASSKIETPVKRLADGVDYKVMEPWRMFVIQFLNIAGLGPIFGAILGAAYGPVAYIWIVVGCIFMGSVCDYFSGMLSIRNDGMSPPNIVAKYLGKRVKQAMLLFISVLLIAVGSSFVTGPVDLIASVTSSNKIYWLYIVFAYYIVATLLPIDKIIGRIYPFMGALLLFMAVSVAIVMVIKGFSGEITLVELSSETFKSFKSDPDNNILIPMLFIVISCGAISGFHATQSPMMARCMADEKHGRPVFYGAMISEGIVALIWATAAMAYFGGPEELNAAADSGMSPAIIVDKVCRSWLGKIGGIFAIIGVIICPITSGDTAFRSLRLMISDALKVNQKPILNRILIAVPIFILAYLICEFDFSTIWKYVGIGNQLLAAIFLWTCATYLARKGKNHFLFSIPATFITFVCVCYFLIAPYKNGGLYLDHTVSYVVGVGVAICLFVVFLIRKNKLKTKDLD